MKVWFPGVREELWNSIKEAVEIFFQFRANHTIPNQDIISLLLGRFDPFLGQKYQQVNGFDLRTHIPWTNGLSWVKRYRSHPLTNSKNIFLVRQTCDWGFCTSLAHGDTVLVIIVSPNWVQVSHGKVRDTQTETIEQTWLTKNYTVTNQDVI